MEQKIKNSDNHHHLWNTFRLMKNHIRSLIFVQRYLLAHLVFLQSLDVSFYLNKFCIQLFQFIIKICLSYEISISELVAKFTRFNGAAKCSAVKLLNSYVVIYSLLWSWPFFFQFPQFLCRTQFSELNWCINGLNSIDFFN